VLGAAASLSMLSPVIGDVGIVVEDDKRGEAPSQSPFESKKPWKG